MKLLVTAAALAALIATPVLAQTPKHKPAPNAQTQQHQQNTTLRAHSTNPSYDVYDDAGHYLGSDPDATVRTQILHDQGDGD